MSKRVKAQRSEEEVNYWQSISDIMTAILLIILLVMMLFILYITRIPDAELIGEEADIEEIHDEIHEHDYDGGEDAYRSIYTPRVHEDYRRENGGSSGSDGRGGGDQEGIYEYPNPGIGDDTGMEKAAVYVTVLDGETGLTVKEAGISFQLSKGNKGIQTLYTYYPVRESFTVFETSQAGNFYLPEKIPLGTYTLSEITVPYGYDLAEDVRFSITESHDWDDPYSLVINIYPCKNSISVYNVDSETGEAVPGGSYEIVAATDIITADGTKRYTQDEVVEEIICDGDGFAQSSEIYLGIYRLQQKEPPQYYARLNESAEVKLPRKDEEKPFEPLKLNQERTRFILNVRDELYEEQGISGTIFSLYHKDGARIKNFKTDDDGSIQLDTLEKNTNYVLKQVYIPDGYCKNDTAYEIEVTADGRIDDAAEKHEILYERKIRIAVGMQDILFGKLVADRSMALYSNQDELVRHWTTTATHEEIEGIEPGSYYLILDGKKRIDITVEDIKDRQLFSCKVWMTESLLAVSAIAVAVIAGIVCIVILISKRRKRHKEGMKNGQEG